MSVNIKTEGPRKAGLEEQYTRLYLAATKLKGLAYLIEAQGEPGGVPEDAPEVHRGIGLLLQDLSGEVRSVAEAIEETPTGEAVTARNSIQIL